jgi:hypothetical protein
LQASKVETAMEHGTAAESVDVTFVFPARRNIDSLCAAPFLMAFGLYGIANECDSISSVNGTKMSGWIAVGVISVLLSMLVFSFLWQVFGSEIVNLTPTQLRLTRVLLGLRRSRSFELREIQDLRMGTTEWDLLDPLAQSDLFHSGVPCVRFFCRGKIVQFAGGVGPIEINRVIRRIEEQREFASRATSA